MAVSVRLSPEHVARLQSMARAEGVSLSEFLRRAALRYCDELAGQSLEQRLSDILGSVESEGGRARQTGQAFRKARRR